MARGVQGQDAAGVPRLKVFLLWEREVRILCEELREQNGKGRLHLPSPCLDQNGMAFQQELGGFSHFCLKTL